MDAPKSNNQVNKARRQNLRNSLIVNAVHLLSNVDSKTVIRYVNDVCRRYNKDRSTVKYQCLICPSGVTSSWREFDDHHLKKSLHLQNIKTGAKQYTLVCAFCRLVLMSENTDIIFEHFSSHTLETDKSVESKTDSPAAENTIQDNLSGIRSVIVPNLPVRGKSRNFGHKLPTSHDFIPNSGNQKSTDNVGGCKKTENLKTSPLVSPIKEISILKRSANLNTQSNISMQTETSRCSNTIQNVGNVHSKIHTWKKKGFDDMHPTAYPEPAKFSRSCFQLVSPGVQYDFTIHQVLSVSNIEKYISETYYSVYHDLRRLYYSCLKCDINRSIKDNFYAHLKGKKHSSFLRDSVENFVKICDICQLFLVGTLEKITEHFQASSHERLLKLRMDLIKDQIENNYKGEKLGWSGVPSAESISMFFSKDTLDYRITMSLEEAQNAAKAFSQDNRLETDIRKVLQNKCSDFYLEIVGSRKYELAKHHSDVDVYINIGDLTMQDVEPCFSMAVDLFKIKRTVYDAKVPIIRLEHIPTGLNCDINATNSTGGVSSELIKIYLSLDPRVRWVVMAIREWAAANNILGSKKFTSYGITWLVLFFLMLPETRLIPPVELLKSLHEGVKVHINGWNYSFTQDIEKIKKLHDPSIMCPLSKFELLHRFFEFCSTMDAKKIVLFPHDGTVYARNVFANPLVGFCPELHINTEDPEPVRVGGQLMVMDSFRLRENLIRIEENLADHFIHICRKTLDRDWWTETRDDCIF